MSVLYVGAYAWSLSFAASSSSSSKCEATSASGVSVHVSDSACSNCRALSTSGRDSFGANSYGGSMSVLYIGAASASSFAAACAKRDCFSAFRDARIQFTSCWSKLVRRVHWVIELQLSITIKNFSPIHNIRIADTEAVSGELSQHPLIQFDNSHDAILRNASASNFDSAPT
jgi:hypothetical protein